MGSAMREKRYSLPGVPPGTLTPLAGAVVPKAIHLIHYTPERFEEKDVASVEEIAPYKSVPGVIWVNVDGLGDVEIIRQIGTLFGLHPLAMEDVLNVPQRPKVDNYEDHLFLVTRMLHLEKGLQAEQVSIFMGRNFVVTFQEAPGDCLDPIRDRIRKGAGLVRQQGADYLMYAIFDAIVDNYFPFLERLGEIVEEVEDEVAEKPVPRTLRHVQAIKRDLLNVRRCIWPLRDAANALVRDDILLIKKSTRLYLRDCYQHTAYILDVIETYREVTSSMMDVYVSSVSNRLNEVMKVLTVIATIFMPLTFLAGVYGMNFHPELSPYNMPEVTWRYGYPAFWALILATVLVMLILFRRKGWLGQSKDEE